jgi:insertion element IS1 protein InsB
MVFFATDNDISAKNAGISLLVPPQRETKAETVALERNNSRQRHRFARFRRKSIVVSKSKEMVDLTMALFAKFHVNGSMMELLSLLS